MITRNQNKNEDRYVEIKDILSSNKEERQELAKRQYNLENKVSDVQDSLQEEINNNFTRLWGFTEDVEKQLTATLETQKKIILNMKFELVEVLDTKQQNMQ